MTEISNIYKEMQLEKNAKQKRQNKKYNYKGMKNYKLDRINTVVQWPQGF